MSDTFDNDDDGGRLETFYVYKSLHSDESWRAILSGGNIKELPNIDFGMRVFALNEKEAIARARSLYEKIHTYDSDKENIRKFAAAALKYTLSKYSITDGLNDKIKNISQITMKIAIGLNDEYNKYFEQLKEKEPTESK